MTAPPTPLLELAGITKRYGDLVANDDLHLTVAPAEVVAMLGENGAGKSTLMKIVYGLVRADAGTIAVDGRPLDIDSPRDAMRAGIGMVTQEFSLVETMTVAENVSLSTVGWGRVDAAGMRRRVEDVTAAIGVRLEPERLVSSLSIGERQRLEIVKALVHDARVLILDEPTAVLPPPDVRALFDAVRRLRESGIGVLFVSHKLKEVAEISDRVVVLRRGRLVGERRTADVGPAELAGLMMGVADRPVEVGSEESAAIGVVATPAGPAAPEAAVPDTPLLRVERLRVRRGDRFAVDGVSLAIGAGEILGVAGISGNGQTELVDALCGVRAPEAGRLLVGQLDVTGAPVLSRLEAGLGRLTEDRRGSVVPQLSVEQNLVLEDLARFTRFGLLDRRAVRAHAEELIERFEIRAEPTTAVGTLSGGNVQKVLLARTLARRPRVLVAAQPTRGLDIGTFGYVHRQLQELRDSGGAVLLVSEDLDELRALATRIAVMHRGEVVGEMPVQEATNERLGPLMTGAAA